MGVNGKVKNGVVVLDSGSKLPEGAEVRVETVAAGTALAAVARRLAKERAHLPADYALNHGHYANGEPRK